MGDYFCTYGSSLTEVLIQNPAEKEFGNRGRNVLNCIELEMFVIFLVQNANGRFYF